MTTFVLDAAGHVTRVNRLERINDINHDSLYVEPARIGNISYFSTLRGNVQPIDMSRALAKWALIGQEDRSEAEPAPIGRECAAGTPLANWSVAARFGCRSRQPHLC